MEPDNALLRASDQKYFKKRLNTSRRDSKARQTLIPSQRSARTFHKKMSKRTIQMKPQSIFERPGPKTKLLPSYEAGRNQKVGLKKVISEQRLPGIRAPSIQQQTLPNVLPPARKTLTRRTLAGSSLQRVYSNPQFTKLNQDPYFRPKTSAFGYSEGGKFKKDPTKKAPWTSEPVQSITGIKTMTSLAPGNALLKKDKTESSPAKRSLSRQAKRKKTGQKTQRTKMLGVAFDKRPNTSYLLQSVAERMPWPQQPEGRSKLDPMTPVKVFSFKGDVESQFLHSEKDFKMTYQDTMGGKPSGNRIEEVDDFSREEEKFEITSAYSGVMPESPPKSKVMNKTKKPTISDVIKLLQNEPKETGQYFYLIKPDEAGPYDLQPLLELEDHQKLANYEKSYTLSSKGITTYVKDEPVEFITLNDWLADRENYNKIRQKTFFQKFDRWKILRIWKSRINVKKRETVTEILSDKLFILHKHFRPVLLDLKKRCSDMEGINFVELTDSHEAISKEVFSQKQEAKRTYVKEIIESNSKHSREEFRLGIKRVLDELKEKMHEGNDNDESVKKKDEGEQRRVDMKTSESDRVFEDLGFKPNLKFGAKSSLRKECSRFLRCAYLLDFITMDSLTNIYLNSVKLLFNKLEYLSQVPISYEFDATKSQFGESKKIYAHTPEPMFKIEAVFHEDVIHPSDLVEKKIKRFEPPPMGHSTDKDFDPIVHLELEDPNADLEDEEVDILEDTDEDRDMLVRFVCPKIHEIWIKLDPNKSSFVDLLEESINQGYANIKSIERWSRHGELLKYVNVLESWDDKVGDNWDPPDDNYLDCESWLEDQDLKQNQSQIIQNCMHQAFKKIEKYLENFQPFLQQYYDNKNINFETVLHENLKNPHEVLPQLLRMLNKQADDFDNYLPEGKDLGLLKVSFHKVKNELKPNPKKTFEKIKKELPLVIRRRLNSKKQWLFERIDSISSPAIEVDEYVKQVQALDFIDKNFQNVKDEIDLYQNLHRICTENGIEISKDDGKLLSEVFQTISNLTQKVMDSTESIGNKKKNNIDNIKKQLPIFEGEIKEFHKKLDAERFYDIKSDVRQMQDEMKKLSQEFTKFTKKAKKYQEYQTTLEMEVSQFSDVEAVKKHLECLMNLWNALSDWTRMVDDWKISPFKEIETETISKEAEKYTKIVMRCQKGLKDDSTAVLDLKKQVFDFKDTMPIVNALGNKNFKDDHWDEIKTITNIDLELEQLDFCLGELIEKEIAKHQEAIQDISTKATQEAKLSEELKELSDKWNAIELVVKQYKDNSSVISDLEELQVELDDMMTSINTILGNRYIAKLKIEAEILFRSLSMFLDIFDQWKDCQRNWLYLENIFVSEDIRKDTKTDYNDFEKVNKRYGELMKNVNKNPKVKQFAEMKTLKDLQKNNESMDIIQKNLETFLENKRLDFPRFFFLSNDELLQILAAAQDIKKVEKHLNKIFENIMKLKMGEGNASTQILMMISGEGEEVTFFSSVKMGNLDKIEAILKEIEEKMTETIRRRINTTHSGYNFEAPERDKWVFTEIGQVITTVSQIVWTEITENYIEGMQETRYTALDDLLELVKSQLDELTVLIRGKLQKVQRKILISLITADVHNRDIVSDLNRERVDTIENFEWLKQLRYYNYENEPCYVKQVNATLTYGYEYMGAASRLVITPLTDRCWMTITGALHIKLGASPAGPAGTGKTESTKDLSKALGIQCVVFNCSEQIEYKMMARLFSGLVSQGAWACLDEFNRIDEEVLSVIAQQLLTIKFALLRNDKKFEFNNSNLDLNPMCGVFVTMNPGYEGRTELPDNLAVLFRPVAMMIPNYGLIAEIMLFAEGFKDASNLSKKMVQLYKLASEQLSQQKHYDFGMRAVKSVLVMAGTLKRENQNLSEDVVLIRAMRDSNIPKFLSDDLPLFKALIQDLFPKVVIPEVDYGELQSEIVETISRNKLEAKPEFITKVIQLFDTFNVRFGAMIVGPTGGGKTTCYNVLSESMTQLRKKESKDQRFQKVSISILNPKSISMGELYGQEHPDTKEWADGLASMILRENAKNESEDRNWTVFDGPVDAIWIENMNTVLDDTMALCLSNGERIKLKPTMRILFEVQDLAVASPATVSRCGMVYMTPGDLGWAPYVNSWMKRMFTERADKQTPCLNSEAQIFLRELFDSFIDETFESIKHLREYEPIQTFEIQSIISLCNFLENFLNEEVGGFQNNDTADHFRQKLIKFFAFSFIWGIGGSFSTKGYRYVDQIIRKYFNNILPPQETAFEYGINLENMKFEKWAVPEFDYDPTSPYFSILVPTIDTCRYSYLLDICIKNKKPIFFTGETGVGKSVIIQNYLSMNKDSKELSPINLNFSAQTDSYSTQQTIEAPLTKIRGKTVLGASGNNTCVLFIDDVNMPSVERYGAQPPIELLRQLIGQGGFYDRPLFFWKNIEDFTVICSAAPPSGGRANLTPRFTRYFHMLCVPQPSEETMIVIFEGIINGFFQTSKFTSKVSECGRTVVDATIDLYNQVTDRLLPTPSKFHYTFNLRDISKVFQGILMVKPISIENESS